MRKQSNIKKIVILTQVQGIDGWVVEVDGKPFIVERTEDMLTETLKMIKSKYAEV